MAVTGGSAKNGSMPGSIDSRAMATHLEAVLASPMFTSSLRRAQLLRYLCARASAGEASDVNEYAIAVDVFEKPSSFDPRIDSIVRTEMGRLRQKLKDYYAASPSNIRIEIPLRSYVPSFTSTAVDEPPAAEPPPLAPKDRRPMVVAAVLAGVIAAGAFAWGVRMRTPHPPDTTAIVILPFLNLTGESSKEYLGDSLTDELTEVLAESRDLRVVARTSAFQFKGKSNDIREIGRALNAGSVLEGSISNRENQFRVVVQLIRASDGYHLWSHTYDAPLSSLSSVETEIASSTEELLVPAHKPAVEARLAPSANPEAHDLYMRAIYQLQLHTADSLRESIRLSREAVRVDPQYARAYFAIARAANTLSAMSVISGREAAQTGREATLKALAIDPQFSDAHAYLALTTYIYDWNWQEAEKEFKLSLEGQGSHGQAHSWYGWGLMTRRRFKEARSHLEIAEELDPQSPNPRQNLVMTLAFEGDFRAARREADGIFKIYPKSPVAIRDLGLFGILEHNCAAARSAAETAAAWYPQQGDPTGSPSMKVVCGQQAEARKQLEKEAKDSEKEFVSPYSMAQGYSGLHDADRAIEYLEKSAAARESLILYLNVDPLWDPIRKDPRFTALEKKIGLL